MNFDAEHRAVYHSHSRGLAVDAYYDCSRRLRPNFSARCRPGTPVRLRARALRDEQKH